MWSFRNIDNNYIIENLIEAFKVHYHVLIFKKCTPSFIIDGELVIMYTYIDIKIRVKAYWSKIDSMSNQPTQLS